MEDDIKKACEIMEKGGIILYPTDTIWGIGLGADAPEAKRPELWKGTNLLGFALMKIRERLNK